MPFPENTEGAGKVIGKGTFGFNATPGAPFYTLIENGVPGNYAVSIINNSSADINIRYILFNGSEVNRTIPGSVIANFEPTKTFISSVRHVQVQLDEAAQIAGQYMHVRLDDNA
ncbi:hypothetical protein [Alteribacillus bidgolensis]|uniref:Uncharacterized protein n=1 Tax=Alteribacillus bidgolensis TaxID=930129 RepID=A0A1G8QBV0_9BACI|nr:hypothetical protein [Alteribacillus bidgolensis]SDJ02252.1 hypothetical protein SAMN05216352_11915 [Alteribacillus bidgolensis]